MISAPIISAAAIHSEFTFVMMYQHHCSMSLWDDDNLEYRTVMIRTKVLVAAYGVCEEVTRSYDSSWGSGGR